MSKQKKNTLLSILALVIGCMLYVWFRPNTYISRLLGWMNTTQAPPFCSPFIRDLFRFYLPDFLWAFSLSCGLIAIHNPGTTGIIICALAAFLLGAVWELLQHLGVVSGTADIHDAIMYLLASTLCIIFNVKEKKQK